VPLVFDVMALKNVESSTCRLRWTRRSELAVQKLDSSRRR
jgi:hypothetical protein